MTTLSPSTAYLSSGRTGQPPRFADLIRSEWIKTRSLRSTWWTIALIGLFVIGSAAVAATANNNLADGHSGQQPPAFQPFTAFPATGYMMLMVVAGAMGALGAVSEYGNGMIRTTTVAVPARGTLVLAKAVTTAGLWAAAGTVISLGSFLTSQAILDAEHAGVPLTHPGVPRALAASALLAPLCALVGLGLGFLLRHGAATMIASTFVLLILPTLFSTSTRWSATVNHSTLMAAWNRLVQNWGPSPDSLAFMPTVPGSWLVYALWPPVTLALAVVLVRRRDV
ncbi:ABC transporter permease [Streptomyces sp. NBC_00237]|uniref:ABC transporter permease n=1 Tax=Streptomyces sp. NBC_00237 TaxID=2975687 RepID=UPI002254DA9F|nr:ABC transporter permease [Streptomyces sp. NBC_00237]MCX5206171.1 ABC transporter permease [Streptomyces sp. NBC_00237]